MRISDWSSDVWSADLTVKYQLALVEDLHVVAHHFDFRQDMRGKNDAMFTAQLLDQRTNIANLDRIKTDGRLVQNHYHGIVDNGLGNEIGKASCRERVCQYV